MRGRILGVHEGQGTITGEGDVRFTFALASWRGAKPPVAGQWVDFVPQDGGIATDIYLVPGTEGGGAGSELKSLIDSAQASPVAQNVLARIKATPQLPVAVLVLIFTLLFGYAAFPQSGLGDGPRQNEREAMMGKSASLVGTNGALSPMRSELAIARAEIDERIADAPAAVQAQVAEVQSGLSGISWTLFLGHLLWLVPLAAIAVIAFYLLKSRALGMIASIALGVFCLFAAFYPAMLRGSILSAMPPGLQARRGAQLDNAVYLEFGGWLILIGGVACAVLAILFQRDAQAAPTAAPPPYPSPPGSSTY